MSANYKKLGEYIEVLNRRNTDLKLGLDSVRGISNTKQITETSKATVDESVISKFYVISPGEFIYNPRTTRMGDKVGLAFNNTDKPLLFTFNNLAFKIKDSAKNKLLPDYLYLFFCRSEFDRYARINSWGSATELFLFEDLCNIKFAAPDLKEQQKIVNTYNAITKRIQLKQKINENLEKTAQCLFEKIYNDNQSWVDGIISDLGEVVGGATSSTEIKDHFCKNGIHWLSPKDLTSTGYKFISKGETDITEAGYKSCSTKIMPKGTVLLTSRAPVGCLGIAENEICTNQGFKSIIPNTDIQTAYVYYFLKKEIEMLKQNASGTTFDEISGSVLKSLKCKIPPKNIALTFNEQSKSLFNYQRVIQKEISKLQELKQLLISQISKR